MTSYGYYSDDDLDLEVDGKVYKVAVEADCSYWYEPGTMYRSNGDPGDPPESELEVTDVRADWFDEDGNKVEPTKEMESVLEYYLYELDCDEWNLDD